MNLPRVWPTLAGLCTLLLALGSMPARGSGNTPLNDEQQAKVILNRWADAIGGAWRIARRTTMDYTAQFKYGPGVPPVEAHLRARLDGAYRYDYELARIGRLTQAFDGRFTWQRNDVLGFGQLSRETHQVNLGDANFRSLLLIAGQFPGRKKLPDETIDGQQLQVVEMTDQAGARSKWYFDPATGLRVRIEAPDQGGNFVVEFSDFHDVQGAKEPFHTKRTTKGKTTEIIVHSIVYNEEIDHELFAAPIGLVEDNQQIERIMNDHLVGSGYYQLARIKTRRTKARIVMTTSGTASTSTTYQKQPNLLLIQQETPGLGTEWQGYNGEIGWVWSELQGYRVMQGAELQQLVSGADLQGPLRLSASCPFRRLLEEREDSGRRIIGIALASFQGVEGNFYFDTRTKDLVRVETFIQAGANGQLKVVADFSDFRRVDGILIAFQTVVTNPALRMVTTIESVQHDVPIDDAIFQPKKE
ncbi:MAG: hypothetical protein PSW75_04640 [bacterium]|nr:hypothetical protein [bacterium]MDI1336246.1 hypothetical protein [Lacunisphaera sp.]